MARVSSFGVQNTTASSVDVTPVKLGLVSNYAVTDQKANSVSLSNKTTAIDQEELIKYRSYKIPTVNSELNIQYPSPVLSGVQYEIEDQIVLTTTDTVDTDFRVDEPIVVSLRIRHPRSGNISGTWVAAAVTRLLSACKTDAGLWRFDDLMRQAELPVAD